MHFKSLLSDAGQQEEGDTGLVPSFPLRVVQADPGQQRRELSQVEDFIIGILIDHHFETHPSDAYLHDLIRFSLINSSLNLSN